MYSCYEAGPCGYWLHRELSKLGVNNVVIAPTNLSGRRKTDKQDSRKLVDELDRYVKGNREAMSVVSVPNEEQERRRDLFRHRQRLGKEKSRLAMQGASLLLKEQVRLGQAWCKKGNWERLEKEMPASVIYLLGQLKQAIELLNTQHQEVTKRLESMAKQLEVKAPSGVGVLSCLALLLETIEWSRFRNRRNVGSYTGLCPSQHSTGETVRMGSIDHHGNPRVRQVLIEAAWRLLRYQPDYPPLAKLKQAQGSRARRKAVVAVARRLAIDLWRLATHRSTPEKLGLNMAA